MENPSKQDSLIIAKKSTAAGFSMPVFGMGTWQMAGRVERDHDNDDARDIAAIRRAIAAGITHIDTAELYGAGGAEQILGQAIAGTARSKLFLVSKVWHTNLRREAVIASAKASLKRIATDYLDLYLIHIPNPEVPLEETIKAMDELVDQGLVRNIGVSNFSLERMKRAQELSKHKIRVTQCHYNLLYREVEHAGVLDYCQNNDMLLVAWRPLQYGELNFSETESGYPLLLKSICQKYDKSPAQVAINWLISQRSVVTLSTMRSAGHLSENLAALDWQMEPDDIELLRREYPNQQLVSNSVRLQ